MCKSTCSIILTTDMCPAAMIEQSKGRDGCTTHTYTFSPDQVGSRGISMRFRFILLSLLQTKIIHDCTKHSPKLSVSKDVSCQTSDGEATSRDRSESRRSTSTEGRKKFYGDHRRATESFVSSRGRSEGRLLTVNCWRFGFETGWELILRIFCRKFEVLSFSVEKLSK